MMICSPYKMHLYHSLAKHFPSNFQLKLISAETGYCGKTPLLGKCLGIEFLPARQMMQELVRFRPGLVFTDYPAYPSWYAKLYSYLRMQHIPLVAWLLGDFWTEHSAQFTTAPLSTKSLCLLRFFTWSTGMMFADSILTVCRWLEEIVKDRFPEKTTNVLYQGVDPEPWLVQDETLYTFKHPAVGILQDNNILPKVMGLIWFSSVVKQMKDVHFYIAGGGPYTPLVEKAYSGLENAHLIGRLPYHVGVRRFYASTDVYVLPSGLDCCPTTILEASLCGKPTIASRVGGIPELIREGETGWMVQNRHNDEWFSRIRTALEDHELTRRMGENARQHVVEHFGWDNQASKLASIFHHLVS